MMKRFLLFILLLTTLYKSDLFSQSKYEIRSTFYEAESWILFEDYKEALPLYQLLLKVNPTNANFKYRIGQCYINTPGEKEKAISYLEDAVKNINPKYVEDKFKEKGAPYDALYYLANAYRINNQLDKAIETYKLFKKNLNSEVYDSNIVNFQIQTCLNAKELMATPLYIKKQNLGSMINESTSEFNPVISDDGNMIVFSRSEAFYDAILYSVKTNGQWSGPLNMNELLKVDRDLFPTSLSMDGKTLYLYSSADYDGIIYISQFENGIWSPLVKLNENINTKYWESHATISHDNKRLYFTSNRKGTLGGLDIYVSKRDSTGDWGPAENLGPVINTPYNEESPFLSSDDKTLFFSSRGHYNMGGYDVFYSTLLPDGAWSVPLNIGYPLNSTDDDLFFYPSGNGYTGYFSTDIEGGYGKQDIYQVEIFSQDHPRKFFVRGIAKVADLVRNTQDSVKISVMNIRNPEQSISVYSNPKTGEYEFQVPQGSYALTFEGAKSEKVVKNLDLPLTAESDSFVVPGTVLPRTDFKADLKVEGDKNISVTTGDPVLFKIKAEPLSTLTVEQWTGKKLISSKQFYLKDSALGYNMSPVVGDNKVSFKLTDRFNNSDSIDIHVTRTKAAVKQKPVVRPEYTQIITDKQIAALMAMLINRSDGKLKSVISGTDIKNQQFGKVDDLINYIKGEASKNNISPEEIDKLALKVAVMDNVLTQAAVDYLAKNSEGELKQILSELDIYKANLKTWTDLQEYIRLRTTNKISAEELNKIANYILSETDQSISLLREKVLTYSKISGDSTIIRQAVAKTDLSVIKTRERWLQTLYGEWLKQGLTSARFADMLVAISSLPGISTEQYLRDLTDQSAEPLLSSLRTLDLKKEKLRSPQDLLMFLLNNSDKVKYPDEGVFRAISDLIAHKNIPSEEISKYLKTGGKYGLWILYVLLGSGLFLFFFFFWKRKKNEKEKENEQ